MVTIEKVLDEIEELPIYDKEYLEQELHKRVSAEKRKSFIADIHQSESDFRDGRSRTGTADELFKNLSI